MVTVQALEALFVGNSEFEEIEKSGDMFCPFEAVGSVHQEIRHAYFLRYYLDPKRPHGFCSNCLQAVLRAAANAQRLSNGEGTDGQITPLDVHLMALDTAQVRREWRKIDLIVILNDAKLIIPIELKIDAIEHREVAWQNWTVG